MYVCVYVWMHACIYVKFVHVSPGACDSHRRGLDPMDLELQASVSCLRWVLNSGPLEDQPVHLTSDLSLLPHLIVLKTCFLCVCAHICADASGCQKRVLQPLLLGSQLVARCENHTQASARSPSVLTAEPSPQSPFLYLIYETRSLAEPGT